MTFYTFMMRNHRNMDTPAGDLARDMFEDKERFPRNRVAKLDGWHQILRSYLKRQHACNRCLDVFEECWEEYVICVKTRSNRRRL